MVLLLLTVLPIPHSPRIRLIRGPIMIPVKRLPFDLHNSSDLHGFSTVIS